MKAEGDLHIGLLPEERNGVRFLQFLFEAEEETGSENLAHLLRRKRKLLAADLAISTDGGQISATQSGIPISMRGRVSFDLEAVTATHDVHSGELRHSDTVLMLVISDVSRAPATQPKYKYIVGLVTNLQGT